MYRSIVSAVVVSLSLAGGAALAGPPAMSVKAASDREFKLLNPDNPNGPQVAVVAGDMKKGPTSLFFLKFPKGFKSPLHTHSGSYHAVVVEGAPRHMAENDTNAKPLSPGAFWFQPGKMAHSDECTGDTDCVIFVQYTGKFDFQPAGKDAPKGGK